MDKGNILKTIKVLLGLAEEPAPAAPAYTLQDGTGVDVSAMEIGGTVIIGDMPATEGDYTLSDGTTFTVDAMGIITAITPAAPAEPAPVEAEADTAAPAPTQATIDTMVEAAVNKAVGEAMAKYGTAMAKQEQALKSTVQLLEEVLKAPVSDTPKPEQTFSKDQALSKAERFGKLSDTLKNLKK